MYTQRVMVHKTLERGNSKPPASIFGKANRLCKLLVFLGRGGKQSSAFMLRV